MYFGRVPEFLLVNSAARRWPPVSRGNFYPAFFIDASLTILIYLIMQVYELITCVRRANENAGNLISGVQFLINIYIYIFTITAEIPARSLANFYCQ